MKYTKYLMIPFIVLPIGYYLFWISGFTYFFDDVYVYLSYAESLYRYGFIQDLTAYPSTAPITTQNGIVLIYTLLRYFTNDMLVMMHIVNSILILNLLVVFLLLFKIGQELKINHKNLFILILGLSFGFYFYGYYVIPTNDGFYASLSLLAIYITLRMFKEKKPSYMLILLAVSIVLPLFRLQGLVVFIAGFLTFFIILKQYKNASYFIVLLFCSYFVTKFSIYLLINDLTGLKMLSKHLIIYHFDIKTITFSVLELFGNAIPSIFLNFPASRLDIQLALYAKIIFSIMIIILLFLFLIFSFRHKNHKIFFISLIVLGNFGALLLFDVIIDRYIYLNSPLIFLMVLAMFNEKNQKILVYTILLLNISTFIVRLYVKQYDHQSALKNKQYIEKNISNYLLISEMPRQTYFYLQQPSISQLNKINSKSIVLIIGTEFFIKKNSDYIQNEFTIINQRALPLEWPILNNSQPYKTLQIELINKKISK